jgi:hypothetical protein
VAADGVPVHRVARVAPHGPVDANLDEEPWPGLAPLALAPSHGGVAPAGFQATALRLCHDGERLYVAFRCDDLDVWGSYTGRNQPLYEEEVVEAFLAPGGDPRRYFELEANPLGAWFEARIESPDGRRATLRADRDWVCAGWERAVRVHGDLARRDGRHQGWSVEWAIPFAALGAPPPAPGERWRANFFRIDRAGGGQFSAWSPTFADPPDFHVPDRFGVLVF